MDFLIITCKSNISYHRKEFLNLKEKSKDKVKIFLVAFLGNITK